MKKISLFLISILVVTIAFPQRQQISSRDAERAASIWISVHYPEYQSNRNVVSLSNNRGNTLLYEVRFDSINVLLSGSKACLPVLGYYKGEVSIVSNFDSLPCNLRSFIDSYIEEIESCFANNTIRLYYGDEWDDLLEGTLSDTRSSIVVEPLIKTKWNQSFSNDTCDLVAYNHFIPPDDSHHCLHQLVGCGAVALAQVMNYWQYPILYNAPQQFDWCNMTDSLNKCTDNNYESHRDAIAYLMFRCAEDIDSRYGCSSTTSYLVDSKNALVQVYGYDNSAVYSSRFPSLDDWINLIKENLDAKMPVLYRGSSSDGGHAFVCDGYADNDMFHFNWGWNGQYDGFFALTSLTPGEDNYTGRQAAVFNIKPRLTSSICDANLDLEDFYHDNVSLLNNYYPYEITPQTMSSLTSASSTSDVSWRTIPTGATAVYQAHEEIILQDGFEAQLGCEFEARIEPCEQCEDMREGGISANDDDVVADDNLNNDDGDREMLHSPNTSPKTLGTNLFPNPTDGPLTMYTDGEPQQVLIYTLDGRPVGGWRLTALGDDFVTLDVSPLRSGTYLLSVTTPTATRIARFIRH